MKRLSLFLSLTLSLIASIHWYENFDTAYKEALKEKKLLFLFIEREHPKCHWCENMKHRTLSYPDIAEKINTTFIPVKVDKYSSSYPHELYPQYVPTIYIIDPRKKKVIKKIVGYWGKNDFLSDLADIDRQNN